MKRIENKDMPLHPGRQWALRLQPCALGAEKLLERIKHFHTTIH